MTTMRKIDFLKKYCRPSRKLQNEKKFYTRTIRFSPEHEWFELKLSQVFVATYIYSTKYDSTLMWITNRGYLNLCCYEHEYEEEGILVKIPGKLDNNWFEESRFDPLFNHLYSELERVGKESA